MTLEKLEKTIIKLRKEHGDCDIQFESVDSKSLIIRGVTKNKIDWTAMLMNNGDVLCKWYDRNENICRALGSHAGFINSGRKCKAIYERKDT